jgi:hypothetical protein
MKFFLIEMELEDDTALFYLNEADIYVKYDDDTIKWSEECNVGDNKQIKKYLKITRVK